MKVLALSGSPRKKGNSEELLHAVVRGMMLQGAQVETVRIVDLEIHPCIGCGGCDKSGECIFEDDMWDLYEKIIEADRVILCSPIYFYGITAQAKAFVDRLQALWNKKRILTEKGEWQEERDRQGLLVSVAASHGGKLFDGAILTAQYAFDAMGMEYSGEIVARGVDHRGEMAQEKETLAGAEKAGKKFANPAK